MLGRDLERGLDAVAADPAEHGGLGRRGVHHRQAVRRPPAVEPRARRVGGVGVAVAAAVVDDDPVVAREVVQLRLPQARVADRARRQQHDRRAAAAVGLPVQAQPVVGRRVAALVGRARPGPGLGDRHRTSAPPAAVPLERDDLLDAARAVRGADRRRQQPGRELDALGRGVRLPGVRGSRCPARSASSWPAASSAFQTAVRHAPRSPPPQKRVLNGCLNCVPSSWRRSLSIQLIPPPVKLRRAVPGALERLEVGELRAERAAQHRVVAGAGRTRP